MGKDNSDGGVESLRQKATPALELANQFSSPGRDAEARYASRVAIHLTPSTYTNSAEGPERSVSASARSLYLSKQAKTSYPSKAKSKIPRVF